MRHLPQGAIELRGVARVPRSVVPLLLLFLLLPSQEVHPGIRFTVLGAILFSAAIGYFFPASRIVTIDIPASILRISGRMSPWRPAPAWSVPLAKATGFRILWGPNSRQGALMATLDGKDQFLGLVSGISKLELDRAIRMMNRQPASASN